ncbi:MAG: hypothetical protein MUP71_06710 [Candidatus Aminicenantes bacterium]|nr:hypothetical protein [Candidatus Aminicenantes bacterium]
METDLEMVSARKIFWHRDKVAAYLAGEPIFRHPGTGADHRLQPFLPRLPKPQGAVRTLSFSGHGQATFLPLPHIL